jgi:hypothetical protein
VKARLAARLAWSLCAASLALLLLAMVLLVLGRGALFPPSPLAEHTAVSWTEKLAEVLGSLGLPVLGALIAAHQPGNRYGWLWCAIGLSAALSSVTVAYAVYALQVAPGGLAGGAAAGRLSGSLAWLATGLWPFVLLLFPDGRLPSRGWRPVGWAVGLAGAGYVVTAALGPGPSGDYPLEGWAWVVFLAVTVILAPVSLLVRFLRARGQQRQQLKWLAVVGVLGLGWLAATGFLPEDQHPLAVAVVDGISRWALYAAIGIAVLRHRLYDIDRLLNRTVVYGLLTGILVLAYAGTTLALGGVFGRNRSSLAVAGATLAAAAVSQPLRRRLQAAVDRRFNRRRYDAARTIEAFSARLRQQVDLDTLTAELLAVVDQTMQPTQTALWLRPPATRPAP